MSVTYTFSKRSEILSKVVALSEEWDTNETPEFCLIHPKLDHDTATAFHWIIDPKVIPLL